jgi:hypothetical protein
MDTIPPHLAGWAFDLALLVLTAWFVASPDGLRDRGDRSNRTFSLARVQLLWWTVVILGAHFTIFALRGDFWMLNKTCLALLGISTAVTGTGRLIDDRSGVGAGCSEGFFRDILSDDAGPSVHRLQAVLFNFAYGVGFLTQTFGEPGRTGFPELDGATLLVLAVSSGAYIAMKGPEHAGAPAALPTGGQAQAQPRPGPAQGQGLEPGKVPG